MPRRQLLTIVPALTHAWSACTQPCWHQTSLLCPLYTANADFQGGDYCHYIYLKPVPAYTLCMCANQLCKWNSAIGTKAVFQKEHMAVVQQTAMMHVFQYGRAFVCYHLHCMICQAALASAVHGLLFICKTACSPLLTCCLCVSECNNSCCPTQLSRYLP